MTVGLNAKMFVEPLVFVMLDVTVAGLQSNCEDVPGS